MPVVLALMRSRLDRNEKSMPTNEVGLARLIADTNVMMQYGQYVVLNHEWDDAGNVHFEGDIFSTEEWLSRPDLMMIFMEFQPKLTAKALKAVARFYEACDSSAGEDGLETFNERMYMNLYRLMNESGIPVPQSTKYESDED